MFKSGLCDYSDVSILFKENIKINNTGTAAAPSNRNKKVIFKNCAPFPDCISERNNTQVDTAKYIDIVMLIYKLIEYSDNYSKPFRSLWQYCKDIPVVDHDNDIIEFDGVNATDSLTFKAKITCQTDNKGRMNVKIMVLLKYLSNFWRNLENMKLILFWLDLQIVS